MIVSVLFRIHVLAGDGYEDVSVVDAGGLTSGEGAADDK